MAFVSVYTTVGRDHDNQKMPVYPDASSGQRILNPV